jgi:hypothetical protein
MVLATAVPYSKMQGHNDYMCKLVKRGRRGPLRLAVAKLQRG